MTWEADTLDALRRSNIDTVAYLPDSILDGLIDRTEDQQDITSVRVAREEEAVSILGGAWLGGRRGALICQSSGLANSFNALGSHIVPAGLPFIGLVTRRGDLGEHNLAQTAAGYGLPRLLDTIGVRNRGITDPAAIGQAVELAAETAFSTHQPYILLLERTMTGGK